ncbi:MAG: RNA-binding cell elongation regulator Jag/EloR [Solibacillus sp.]
MKQITQIGQTVEEAISLALQKLGHTREQVDVEVLQEGKKGFLGFGSRPAEVRVTVKEIVQPVVNVELEETAEESIETTDVFEERSNVVMEEEAPRSEQDDPIATTKAYLTSIAVEMGVTDLFIQHKVDGKNVFLMLESEKAALLIGKRGHTLNALQQLAQQMLNKSAKSFMILQLDVENYREKREAALEQLADRMADKAVRTRKAVRFEPMASYERKIIHNALSNRLDIETYSEGTEPNRYLVIEPIK